MSIYRKIRLITVEGTQEGSETPASKQRVRNTRKLSGAVIKLERNGDMV